MSAPRVQKVSATEFADKFNEWSCAAKAAPVMVTDSDTGAVEGYFISASDFAAFQQLRERLPRAGYVWEMNPEMVAELSGHCRPITRISIT